MQHKEEWTMRVLGNVLERSDRTGATVDRRTRGQAEAEISRAMIRFKRDRMGRGPTEVRTRIVQDMVIVRMAGVLTAAERTLVRSGGVELLKQVRTRLIESERGTLQQMIREATGCEVASIYSDLCPERGERLIVFILAKEPGWRSPPSE
jgi:uncharacterized protein YbcI